MENDLRLQFRPVTEQDLPELQQLYNDYVRTDTATFHIRPVSLQTMRELLHPGDPVYPSLAAMLNGRLVGYAMLSKFHVREAFDRSAEVTIYLSPEASHRGIGTAALPLLEKLAAGGRIQTLVAKICGENTASAALFQKCGYAECGRLTRIAEKFGRELDLLLYEKQLDR